MDTKYRKYDESDCMDRITLFKLRSELSNVRNCWTKHLTSVVDVNNNLIPCTDHNILGIGIFIVFLNCIGCHLWQTSLTVDHFVIKDGKRIMLNSNLLNRVIWLGWKDHQNNSCTQIKQKLAEFKNMDDQKAAHMSLLQILSFNKCGSTNLLNIVLQGFENCNMINDENESNVKDFLTKNLLCCEEYSAELSAQLNIDNVYQRNDVIIDGSRALLKHFEVNDELEYVPLGLSMSMDDCIKKHGPLHHSLLNYGFGVSKKLLSISQVDSLMLDCDGIMIDGFSNNQLSGEFFRVNLGRHIESTPISPRFMDMAIVIMNKLKLKQYSADDCDCIPVRMGLLHPYRGRYDDYPSVGSCFDDDEIVVYVSLANGNRSLGVKFCWKMESKDDDADDDMSDDDDDDDANDFVWIKPLMSKGDCVVSLGNNTPIVYAGCHSKTESSGGMVWVYKLCSRTHAEYMGSNRMQISPVLKNCTLIRTEQKRPLLCIRSRKQTIVEMANKMVDKHKLATLNDFLQFEDYSSTITQAMLAGIVEYGFTDVIVPKACVSQINNDLLHLLAEKANCIVDVLDECLQVVTLIVHPHEMSRYNLKSENILLTLIVVDAKFDGLSVAVFPGFKHKPVVDDTIDSKKSRRILCFYHGLWFALTEPENCFFEKYFVVFKFVYSWDKV